MKRVWTDRELAELARMSPEELEDVADQILAEDLRSRKPTKSRDREYPILSEHQMERRRRREIPFSSLSTSEKVRLGLRTDG